MLSQTQGILEGSMASTPLNLDKKLDILNDSMGPKSLPTKHS